MWTDDRVSARDQFVELLCRCDELGDASLPPTVLAQLAQVECELGRARTRACARPGGPGGLRAERATHPVRAQSCAGRTRRRSSARSIRPEPPPPARSSSCPRPVPPRTAHRGARSASSSWRSAIRRRRSPWLSPTVAFVRQEGIVEPGVALFVVDQIEALIELGRGDEAVELLDWYEANARGLERVSARASCLRCRGCSRLRRDRWTRRCRRTGTRSNGMGRSSSRSIAPGRCSRSAPRSVERSAGGRPERQSRRRSPYSSGLVPGSGRREPVQSYSESAVGQLRRDP